MNVILKPSKVASAWTKHRLRTHKGIWTIEDRAKALCWNFLDCIRVKCSDGWHGWIPCNEVIIQEEINV